MTALLPEGLPVVETLSRHTSGRHWLAQLPTLVGELRECWQLQLGTPYHGGSCSWVAPAWRSDGSPAVFKVTWPHPEMLQEAAVLRQWDGNGAVQVYAHDAERHALLLERCTPGTELGREERLSPEQRLREGCAVLRELWAQADPDSVPDVDRLHEVAADWADAADERAQRPHWPRGMDTGLFRLAAGLLRELPGTTRHNVLLHGDFNPGNLLAAERRPWLAIDAKPMTGDPAFDPWPLIEQIGDPFATADPRHTLAHRTALVADELGEDPARLRAWAVARHVEYALWSVDEDDTLTRSIQLLEQARVLADLAEL